jgi:hypothetical protein
MERHSSGGAAFHWADSIQPAHKLGLKTIGVAILLRMVAVRMIANSCSMPPLQRLEFSSDPEGDVRWASSMRMTHGV